MKNLPNARSELAAFVDLLLIRGGFDLSAHIHQPSSNGTPNRPELTVEFKGPDTPLLIARNGELLYAIEHLAATILGLGPEEQHLISFDAGSFKARREFELHRVATAGIAAVWANRTPYVFPPMMSRERRLLHLALAGSGLRSASIGEGSHRSVVLYPEGVTPPADILLSRPTMG